MLTHELTGASYVVNQAALGSLGFDSSLCSYTSSGSIPQNAFVSTSVHCCVCSGACMHTNAPSYCSLHSPWQQQFVPFPLQGVGTGIAPVLPSQSFPNSNTWTWQSFGNDTTRNCYICKDELTSKEVANEDKVCSACRTAVEAFKQVLVEETPDEKPRKRKRK